jgi:hypothetical protein
MDHIGFDLVDYWLDIVTVAYTDNFDWSFEFVITIGNTGHRHPSEEDNTFIISTFVVVFRDIIVLKYLRIFVKSSLDSFSICP